MPHINKEKGKQHHKRNGGNAKTIRASAAERKGAQKGEGGLSWRGEEAIGQGNVGATGRARTWAGGNWNKTRKTISRSTTRRLGRGNRHHHRRRRCNNNHKNPDFNLKTTIGVG